LHIAAKAGHAVERTGFRIIAEFHVSSIRLPRS
jgi:hypothetical protein